MVLLISPYPRYCSSRRASSSSISAYGSWASWYRESSYQFFFIGAENWERLTISVVDPSEDTGDFVGDFPLPLAEAEVAWQAWAANLHISASSSGDFPERKSRMEEDGCSSTCLISGNSSKTNFMILSLSKLSQHLTAKFLIKILFLIW